MKLEYEATAYSVELHNAVVENYRTFAQLITRQQNFYSDKTCLIAHQLALCFNWKLAMKHVEEMILSFSTIPKMLQASRKLQNVPLKFYVSVTEEDADGVGIRGERFYQTTKAIQLQHEIAKRMFDRWDKLRYLSFKSNFYLIFTQIKAITHQFHQILTLKDEIKALQSAVIPSGKVLHVIELMNHEFLFVWHRIRV
jgi:hypothetical protein